MGCTEICMDNKTWKAIYKRPPLLLGSIEMVLVHMKYNGFLEIICVCVYIYKTLFLSLSYSHTDKHTWNAFGPLVFMFYFPLADGL